MGLEDGRLALCLPVRSPNGNVVGVAMILADRKSVGDDTLERMTAAPVRTIMQRLAVLLRPGDRPSSGTARVPVLELDDDPPLPPLMAVEERIPTAAAAPGGAGVDTPISATEIDDILEFDLDPQASAARQEAPAVAPTSAMATPKKPERWPRCSTPASWTWLSWISEPRGQGAHGACIEARRGAAPRGGYSCATPQSAAAAGPRRGPRRRPRPSWHPLPLLHRWRRQPRLPYHRAPGPCARRTRRSHPRPVRRGGCLRRQRRARQRPRSAAGTAAVCRCEPVARPVATR